MSQCPDVSELRAFAEDPASSTLAGHVDGCGRCARLVECARQEEAALRGALPVTPPADLLEKTLAAIGPEPPRRRPRRESAKGPGALLPLVLVLALGGALVAVLWDSGSVDVPADVETDGEVDSLDPARPDADPPPADERVVADRPDGPPPSDPGQDPVAPTDPVLPDPPSVDSPPGLPDRDLPADTPPEAVPADDPPAAPTQSRALARLEAGKLTADGQLLAVGQDVPRGVALRVGTGGARLVSEGAARLWLAARTRCSLSEDAGRRVVRLEKGSVFARTVGEQLYAIATADGEATPVGTEFLVERATSTKVRTLQGTVHLSLGDGSDLQVRAGFAAQVKRGRPAGLPAPAHGKLPAFLREARPATPPRFQVVRSFAFERGPEGFQKGEHHRGGARGSQGALRAVRRDDDYAVFVELEQTAGPGVLTLEPDLWIEVTLRVSKKARVVVQLWDADARENLARFTTAEPGRWLTLAAPLRAFTDATGNPRRAAVAKGNRCTSFDVFAGEAGGDVELLVDDVRFSLAR